MTASPTRVASSALLAADFYACVDQGRANAALQQAVMDRFLASSGLRQNATDELTAIRAASDKANIVAAEGIAAFEREIRAADVPTVGQSSITSAAELRLDTDFFEAFTSANEKIASAFASLMQQHRGSGSDAHATDLERGGDGPSAVTSGSSAAMFAQRDPSPTSTGVTLGAPPILAELRNDRTRLARKQELVTELMAWRDQLLPLGDEGAVDGVLAVCDLELADPLRVLRAELQRMSAPLAAADATLRGTLDERSAALRAEELAAAETLSSNAFDLEQNRLKLVGNRVKIATDAWSDVEDFLLQVSESRVVLENVDTARTRVAETVKKCDGDFERLSQWFTALAADADKHREVYRDESGARHATLRQYAVEEQNTWQEVATLLTKLEGIHRKREDLVTAHLHAAEAEENRKALFDARARAARDHAARLEALRATLRGADELLHLLNESCDKSYVAIDRKAWPRKQNDIVVKECVRYHDSYMQFVLFAGELLNRTMQRKANLQRLLRSVDFQVRTAADMLDADLPVYRDQQRKYLAAVQVLDERLKALRGAQAEQAELWRPIEACLDENDVEFNPPELALQELQRDLAQAHVEAVDEITNEEQTMLDTEKRAARNMSNLVDATKASFEERRMTKSAAKKTPSATPVKSEAASPAPSATPAAAQPVARNLLSS